MADDPPAGGEPPAGDRLDRLEETQREQGTALQRIETALAKIVPGSHAEAQDRVQDRLDRPSQAEGTIAEQVQAELRKAREKDARDAAAAKERADRDAAEQSTAERLAKLEEKPPQPPARRVTKLLGWGS